MGKHMLEKGEFPIFYYGQEWFGSLSAMVHAGVFLVLGGIPPWSIHAAPLLFFLGFCLVLYRLTRDTLGPAVALWALAWNIATPVHLAEYAVMPHGGYVESLMLGTLLLWLAVRLVMARGTWRQRGYYALLGFVGGVAWWTSPLVVYQILASGIYVVMRERMAAVLKGALLSLPAFFLGAAPFFYFYAVDPYSSVLGLGGGYALANIPTGLSLLVTERLPEYLDWTLFPSKLPFAYGLAAGVYGASTLALLWHLRRSFRAQSPLRHAAIFPIFFLVVTLLLTASIHIRRSAPQYALPLSAFFPVAVAFCLVHAPRRWRLVTWSGCAAVFLLHGWTTAAWVVRDAPHAESATRGYLSLIRGLEANGVARLYIPATPGSEILNFYARERVIASQVTRERYPPNFEALERDPGPAFLFPRGTDTLTPTLKVLGASQETERVGGYDLIRHVRPTDRRYRQVPGSVLRGSASHEAESMGLAVDRNMDSAWESVQPRTPGMWVELDLGTPVNVGMVRLWNRGQDHGHYAMELRVETSLDGTAWRDAVPRSAVDYFYTSGPRVYPWEWGYRWEARFAPVLARRIRISQHEDGGRYPWKIAEAYVYEDLGARPPGHTGEPDVLRRVAELGLDRVYADRWMSARISESSQGRVETITPFTAAMPAFYVRLQSRVIRWGERTGFVLEDGDADEFERQMRDEGVHRLVREDFGRWVLFHVRGAGAATGALEDDPGWWWMGLGAVRTDPRGKSRYLAGLAQAAYGDGRVDQAVELSRKAVGAEACNIEARHVLIDSLGKLGLEAEAARESRTLVDQCEPRVRTPAAFQGTLQLLGYTLDRERAAPGQDVRVRYFWKMKRDPGDGRSIGVFVHLVQMQDRKRRFHEYHRLLEKEGAEDGGHPLREGDLIIREAWIRVPGDAAPGAYRMLLGVYDLKTGQGWAAAVGETAARRDRVPLGVLHVEAAGTP